MFSLSFWVAQVDLLVAGFPCVSISPLTTTPGSVADDQCASGSGFSSVEGYVKKHRPSMVCLENVKAIFNQRSVENGDSGFLELEFANIMLLN